MVELFISVTLIEKRSSCLDCDFYCMVQEEEGLADRRTKFLQFLQSEDRSPFFEKMTYLHVKAGQRFVVQGQIEDTAYIIQRGSCLVIVEKDGDLHPVDHYGEGEIVGGLGILTGEPRRAHVEAETDMDLWVMTRRQFDEITEKDPDLLNFITVLVADRLDSHRPTAYRTIGKYVATDIIGRGAFSIVYKGRHKELGLPVDTDYVEIICGSLDKLAEAFVQLDQDDQSKRQKNLPSTAPDELKCVLQLSTSSLSTADRRIVRTEDMNRIIKRAAKSRAPRLSIEA